MDLAWRNCGFSMGKYDLSCVCVVGMTALIYEALGLLGKYSMM